jgi:hypothetical protein
VTNKNKSAYVTIRTPPLKIDYEFGVRFNRQPLSVAAPKKNGNTTQNILQVFFHVQAPRTRFLGVFSYAPKNY